MQREVGAEIARRHVDQLDAAGTDELQVLVRLGQRPGVEDLDLQRAARPLLDLRRPPAVRFRRHRVLGPLARHLEQSLRRGRGACERADQGKSCGNPTVFHVHFPCDSCAAVAATLNRAGRISGTDFCCKRFSILITQYSYTIHAM
jgi:hypothetical protein